MFLDEPTNHLDIQSVDALAEALIKFAGGVIFITHDQRYVHGVSFFFLFFFLFSSSFLLSADRLVISLGW
jgi:ABC-type bacteriocin/lantibiotic exporter with double-glycine peptidase domain